MKKLLFLSVLLSSAFSFAAVPRVVAPKNALINQRGMREAQAFNLIKEALERKAWDRGESLSKEEIREIIDNEICFFLNERFIRNIYSAKSFNVLSESTKMLVVTGVILGSYFRTSFLRELSLLKYYAICGGLAGLGYVYFWLSHACDDGFFSNWLKTKRLEKSGYSRILDSRFIAKVYPYDLNQYHLNQFYNELVGEKCDARSLILQRRWILQQSLQKLYPNKYPNLESLKIDFEKIKKMQAEKEMQAVQALVADRTHADGTQRRVNAGFAQEMYALLAAPKN